MLKKKLSEINEHELQTLLSKELSSRHVSTKKTPREYYDVDKIIAQLDEELELGIGKPKAAQPKITAHKISNDPQFRIDLGIAYLEMSLYEQAIQQFSAVRKRMASTESSDPLLLIATDLEAYAQILSLNYFEAILILKPAIHSLSASPEQKADLYYLLGRAYEGLEKFNEALQSYTRAAQIRPHYRDVRIRLENLKNR